VRCEVQIILIFLKRIAAVLGEVESPTQARDGIDCVEVKVRPVSVLLVIAAVKVPAKVEAEGKF